MDQQVEEIIQSVNKIISPYGFEAYPFKVEWYNELVEEKFQLPYPKDTLALTILSNPRMFEKAFIPFLRENYKETEKDPIDDCVKHYITKIQEDYPQTDLRYDFEMIAPRYPRLLAQTAAHVSGAAFYYQKIDVEENPWGDKQIFGLCLHPKYGGWFGIRAGIFFKDIQFPDLPKKDPVDLLPTQESRIRLLNMLNIEFKYWECRDIIEVSEKYSEEAIKYFKAYGEERKKITEEMLNNKE